ncbi:hypothetical protein HXY32_03440 [Candidatus Bathyarchaeota archaeon]|nr:hypothetical protein [Candidatus Bathyarchaeota archaeon]
MKEKLLLVTAAILLAALASAPLAQAFPTVNAYGYTDKSQYKPGETVTLKFWIYNWGPEDIILKNVSIRYPWYNIIWGGNATFTSINFALAKDQNWTPTQTFTFTIPTDGRATGGGIEISFVFTYGGNQYERTDYITLNVASAPWFMSFENMDKIVTLFTVLVVLVIVCTVIIAATIFLAGRRPQVTWKAEQKAE